MCMTQSTNPSNFSSTPHSSLAFGTNSPGSQTQLDAAVFHWQVALLLARDLQQWDADPGVHRAATVQQQQLRQGGADGLALLATRH
eukprot:1375559-Rhodomonas_salina.2